MKRAFVRAAVDSADLWTTLRVDTQALDKRCALTHTAHSLGDDDDEVEVETKRC